MVKLTAESYIYQVRDMNSLLLFAGGGVPVRGGAPEAPIKGAMVEVGAGEISIRAEAEEDGGKPVEAPENKSPSG
jgi:hypothetical protein